MNSTYAFGLQFVFCVETEKHWKQSIFRILGMWHFIRHQFILSWLEFSAQLLPLVSLFLVGKYDVSCSAFCWTLLSWYSRGRRERCTKAHIYMNRNIPPRSVWSCLLSFCPSTLATGLVGITNVISYTGFHDWAATGSPDCLSAPVFEPGLITQSLSLLSDSLAATHY